MSRLLRDDPRDGSRGRGIREQENVDTLSTFQMIANAIFLLLAPECPGSVVAKQPLRVPRYETVAIDWPPFNYRRTLYEVTEEVLKPAVDRLAGAMRTGTWTWDSRFEFQEPGMIVRSRA